MNLSITGATWATGNATFTTSAAHGIGPGTQVSISGITPVGYNGTFTAGAGTTGSTIIVPMATNPGTYASGGSASSDPFAVYPKMRGGLIALAADGSIWYTAKNAMTMVAPAGTVTHPDALMAAAEPATVKVGDDDDDDEPANRHKSKPQHRR